MHGAKDGAFRATFEDKPLLSDIVFLRAWVAVDLPRFYNPVTNLLAPAPVACRALKPSKVLSSLPGEQGDWWSGLPRACPYTARAQRVS